MGEKVYTYPYSHDYHPSMPVIEVGLNVPGRSQAEKLLAALIDSGSDGTLIPIDVLEEVGARHVGNARIRGILGDSQPVDIFLARPAHWITFNSRRSDCSYSRRQ